MNNSKKLCIVTGSSGFVGSYLVPEIKKITNVVGIDVVPSKHTNFCIDLGNDDLKEIFDEFINYEICIINLAAARFDFGTKPEEYYNKNVLSTENFLRSLKNLNISKFIHISSVASFDGEYIKFKNNLSCDDAYRATKNLQEKRIFKWCKKNSIKNYTIYPSAIFIDISRSDTNIGKLQEISKYLPFIPQINVRKSLTYLPFLTNFIIECLINNKLNNGRYLAIERPVLTVTEIIKFNTKKDLIILKVPFLKFFLYIISYILYLVGGLGRLDLKLTPNRVNKIFTDTSYEQIKDIDFLSYNDLNSKDQKKITHT